MLNGSGEEVETSDEATTYVYEIMLERLITGVSSTSTTITTLSSQSDIVLTENAVVSGTPLSGKYKVRCWYNNADGS
jgi:hypothetical protein